MVKKIQVVVFWEVMLLLHGVTTQKTLTVNTHILHFKSRSSGSWCHVMLQQDAIVSYHNTTRCHKPEYLDLKHHCCESLKTCIYSMVRFSYKDRNVKDSILNGIKHSTSLICFQLLYEWHKHTHTHSTILIKDLRLLCQGSGRLPEMFGVQLLIV
jgi:hypothetical protein